jgi:hypothetical protein
MQLPTFRRQCRHDGSLLITAAVASAVIAILIGGMLVYISNEYRLNVRSHKWNQALNLAEAGVDMAFAEFNNYWMVNPSTAFQASRGWYSLGGGSYYRYVTSYTNASGAGIGIVYSQVNNVGSSHPSIFAYGGVSGIPSGTVYRAVSSVLANSSRFPAGMVAKNRIDMNGNNVATDSYDSSDVSKSSNYKYDPTKKQPNGDIASDDTITNTLDISIGNANIYGSVLTSPGGSVTMGPGGNVGSSFVTRYGTVAAAQAAGAIRNDFQVDIPDVTLPVGASSWSSVGSISGSSPLGSGGSASYRTSGITLNGNDTLTINGNITLYVTGNIDMSGNGQIVISSGSRLTIYVAGSVSIGGNGIANGVAGDNNSDMNLQLYGLNSSTSWTISGNGIWNGIVYAPYADLTMNGGGSSGEMSGAIVAKSITMNGQVKFHYDEALRHSSLFASYDLASWQSSRWNPTQSRWIPDN